MSNDKEHLMNELTRAPKVSLVQKMALEQSVEPAAFLDAVKATCFGKVKTEITDAHLAAFLMVANEYGLNPLVKEIYAFPSDKGIIPVVSIDGWNGLANENPHFDGLETAEVFDDADNVIGVKATVHRKDRTHPTVVTEWMAECRRNTDPWNRWPRRMLRHKATIQAYRYAFGFANIHDPDEAERILEVEAVVVKPKELPEGKTSLRTKPKPPADASPPVTAEKILEETVSTPPAKTGPADDNVKAAPPALAADPEADALFDSGFKTKEQRQEFVDRVNAPAEGEEEPKSFVQLQFKRSPTTAQENKLKGLGYEWDRSNSPRTKPLYFANATPGALEFANTYHDNALAEMTMVNA